MTGILTCNRPIGKPRHRTESKNISVNVRNWMNSTCSKNYWRELVNIGSTSDKNVNGTFQVNLLEWHVLNNIPELGHWSVGPVVT